MLCYVTLCYVTLCYVTLRYVMLRYVMLCYVTLRYVTLRYVMLCYVIFQTLCYTKYYLRCAVFTSHLIYWWRHYCCLLVCVFVRWFIWYYILFKTNHVVSSVKFTFILLQRRLTEDCRQHLTAEAEVRPQTSPYTICVGQSAVGHDRFLSGYFGFPMSLSFQHCSMIIHSSWPLHNSGNRQRS